MTSRSTGLGTRACGTSAWHGHRAPVEQVVANQVGEHLWVGQLPVQVERVPDAVLVGPRTRELMRDQTPGVLRRPSVAAGLEHLPRTVDVLVPQEQIRVDARPLVRRGIETVSERRAFQDQRQDPRVVQGPKHRLQFHLTKRLDHRGGAGRAMQMFTNRLRPRRGFHRPGGQSCLDPVLGGRDEHGVRKRVAAVGRPGRCIATQRGSHELRAL
jgi:hypothetical protein